MTPIKETIERLEGQLADIQELGFESIPALITAFKELEVERDRLKLLAADVERQNQAQADEIGEWKRKMFKAEFALRTYANNNPSPQIAKDVLGIKQ